MLITPSRRYDGGQVPVRPFGFNPSLGFAPFRFAAVAIDGNFFNVVRGSVGAVTGSPTSVISGVVGRNLKFATVKHVDFSGQSTTNDAAVTFAAIVNYTENGLAQMFLANSGANSGYRFGAGNSSAGQLAFTIGGVAHVSSGLTLAAGSQYFVAASTNRVTANFLRLNLGTGAIRTVSMADGNTPSAPNGTYIVGNDFADEFCTAGISAVMFSGSYASLPRLYELARDPWNIWYPPTLSNIYAKPAAAAGGFFSRYYYDMGNQINV